VIINPSAPPVLVDTVDGSTVITIRELLDKLYDAKEKMSDSNPHRALIVHAMSAIMQMSSLIERLQNGEDVAIGGPVQ
jgi:ABC-type branched-subunit amino acid transport system ATPase component